MKTSRITPALAIVFAVLLSGCAATVDLMNAAAGMGQVKVSEASFDGSTTVEVTPVPTYANKGLTTNSIRLGGFWNSNNPDIMYLVSSFESSTASNILYVNLDKIEVRIGDEFFTLYPVGSTKLDSGSYNEITGRIYTRSEQPVLAPMDLIERMMTAPDVRMRIHTGRGYEDSFFHIERIPGGQQTAKVALKKMLLEVEKYR